MKNLIFASALLVLFHGSESVHASSATPMGKTSNEPLEITADESLEWNRKDQIFTARKNALAVQGTSSVAGQILIARYRSSEKSDLEIYEVEAQEKVKISNQQSTAYGDKAVYNLDKGYAELTGGDLRLVSPDQTITAKDRFEYWVTEGRARALGSPKVIRPKPEGSGQDTLEANELEARFKQDNNGNRVIDTLEAKGNVVITTPTEVVTGAYGIYRSATNKAELTGGVTIKRGPNILEGERAVVDLTTNTSQIFGAPSVNGQTQGGRVKGVFYPGSEKQPDEKQPEAVVKTPENLAPQANETTPIKPLEPKPLLTQP